MATNYMYLTGQAYWSKLYPTNCDIYNGEKNAQLEVVLDLPQIKALKAQGSRLVPRINDDGKMVVKFRRKIEHRVPELGGFPTVIDAEGVPTTKLIGNGSDVTVKISIYDAGEIKGTRLESVRIDKLVEYEPESNPLPDGPPTTESTFLKGLPF